MRLPPAKSEYRIALWMVEEGVSAQLHEALSEKKEKGKTKAAG